MIRVSFIVVDISQPQREIQKPKFLAAAKEGNEVKIFVEEHYAGDILVLAVVPH